ncbi:MAG TPA: SDR family oxidoreductase [Acidobacteriaceae bacterium]|jgi:NAD(P)-dependent dehydrogenase (short-subunit alcohol dehydrogenase family)|nr:SDR family oxidoreductase [Acidobacteriaceae bacterium]
MAEAKVALISGANKGLGLETARQLGQTGYTVLLGSRDPEKGTVAAEQLRKEGINATAVRLDVTSQADIDAVAKLIEEQFGGVLDVLVNNAGVMFEKGWTTNITSEIKMDELRATFEANVFAPFALTKALLPALKKAQAARVVNVSSVLGSMTLQGTKGSATYNTKLFAYNASKAALNMFTIHLAHELRGTKIKVNSAHPGWVKTDLGGSAAPLDVTEGAKTIVRLATLGEEGPTGGYFHGDEMIPW